MAKTYTVKWGDTLSEIAKEHGTTWQTLQKINNIPNANFIVVGQVIKLADDGTTAKKITNQKVKINTYGLSVTGDRTMYVTWSWDRANTKEYSVEWYDYYDGYWHRRANTITHPDKYSEFTANEKATDVKVKIKPVAKTYTNSKNKEVAYWTNVNWMTSDTYSFSNNPPLVPNKPTIAISETKLTATVDGLTSSSASTIQFQLLKDDVATTTKKIALKNNLTDTGKISTEFTVATGGSKYCVRVRAYKNNSYSAWSTISNEEQTIPSTPTITKCIGTNVDHQYEVSWTSVQTVTEGTLEFYKDSTFSVNPNSVDKTEVQKITLTTDDIKTCKKIVDMTINIWKTSTIYFRIKVKNGAGESDWSNVVSTASTEAPIAPTTWSDRSSITVGDLVTLNWTHDDELGSATYSQLDLYVDGVRKVIPTITHADDESNDKFYTLNTTNGIDDEDDNTYDISCPEGAIIQWRVRTAGKNGMLGDWSVIRTIYAYARPALDFYAIDASGNSLTTPFTLSSYPLRLLCDVKYATDDGSQPTKGIEVFRQSAISYHISITANNTHQTVNNYGETVTIQEGDVVYANNYDVLDPEDPNLMTFDISAGDVNFAINCDYTVTCIVTMDSGLSATSSFSFVSVLRQSDYILDANIYVDTENYSAIIHPYCTDSTGRYPTKNVKLAVYRREYNGTFTLISDNIDNTVEEVTSGNAATVMNNTFVTDPHPALDYARYRIVAVGDGATTYTDLPAYPVQCKAAIIQWGETWSSFDDSEEYDDEDVSWSGNILKLPYNIDVSYKTSPDVSLVKYIGRKYPVDYYGTHRGETSTWNVVIKKDDVETIYALYRLSEWMGNVYVREPSGTGYWANIKVSFNRKHRDTTIPVTFEITRVEGGM